MLFYHVVRKKKPEETLVQDVVYLNFHNNILSRTLSITPVTIGGRLPFLSSAHLQSLFLSSVTGSPPD